MKSMKRHNGVNANISLGNIILNKVAKRSQQLQLYREGLILPYEPYFQCYIAGLEWTEQKHMFLMKIVECVIKIHPEFLENWTIKNITRDIVW